MRNYPLSNSSVSFETSEHLEDTIEFLEEDSDVIKSNIPSYV